MPSSKPKPAMVPPTAAEEVSKALNAYEQNLMAKMDKRYKELLAALNKETNIATRYELKVQLEELTLTYKLLFDK